MPPQIMLLFFYVKRKLNDADSISEIMLTFIHVYIQFHLARLEKSTAHLHTDGRHTSRNVICCVTYDLCGRAT